MVAMASTSYASSAPTTAPSTPRKRHGFDFEKWFLEFSNTYNLNLRLPAPGTSPAKRKTLAERNPELALELSLFPRLQYHYFRGNCQQIQESFDEAARKVHLKWVDKPDADPDTLPPITHLPRATSDPERKALLVCLNEILEALHPSRTSSLISSRYAVSPLSSRSPSYSRPVSPSLSRQLHRSKRRSEERQPSPPSFSFKKPRSIASPSTRYSDEEETEEDEDGVTDLESVHTIQRTIFTRVDPSSQQSRRSRQSFYQSGQSTNVSKTTIASNVSNVFEQEEGPPPASQQTQTTVEASSQEKARRPPLSDSFSDFAPSSGTERALQASFSNYEEGPTARPNNELQENVRSTLVLDEIDPRIDASLTHDTINTPTKPPILRPDLSVPSPTPSPFKTPKTPRSGKISLEDRLDGVWRMYFPPNSPRSNTVLMILSATSFLTG